MAFENLTFPEFVLGQTPVWPAIASFEQGPPA
jgi:hypothetical protein